MKIPKFYDLMTPVIRALENLDGSAHIRELVDEVLDILEPSEKTLPFLSIPGRTRSSKIECRIVNANKYLCLYGVIESVENDVWKLTDRHESGMTVTHEDIISYALEKYNAKNILA